MRKKLLITTILLSVAFVSFAQQADWTMIPYRTGDKWGYSSVDQNVLIQPQYEDAGWFYGGYAVVKKGGKYGYIDRTGKVVIPFKYFSAKPFRYGYVDNKAKNKSDTVLFAGAAPKADGYEICINTRGERLNVCPAMNENADPTNKGPMEVKEKVYSLTSTNGLFDKIFDDYTVPGSADNYYIAQKNNLYGVFNNKFEVLIPFEYNALTRVTVGDKVYLVAKKMDVNGVFRGDGSILIPVENSSIAYVKGRDNDNYFIISKDGKAYARTLENKDVFISQYADISYDNNGGFVITDAGNNRGFYYLNNTLVAPKYSDVKLVNNSSFLLVKTKTGKAGYVSANGTEYFKD